MSRPDTPQLSDPIPPATVGLGDQSGGAWGGVAALKNPIVWMRLCLICEREERFTAVLECAGGLIGSCLGCGDERFLPFSRATTEVA